MANVALPIATLAYEDQIKTGFVNPLLAHIFGAPGAGPTSLSELRSSLFKPEMNLLTPTMIDASYRRQNFDPGNRRADPEAAHGRALMSIPTPMLNVVNNLRVTIDGKAVAAAVESRIVTNNRYVDSASGHDGAADWRPRIIISGDAARERAHQRPVTLGLAASRRRWDDLQLTQSPTTAVRQNRGRYTGMI
jgi:hypothetical protein